MANIIHTLTARIEEYRADNKNPCKNYATEAAAEKATAQMAQYCANHFDRNQGQGGVPPAADYVVFYVESWGRWVGCINQSEVMRRSTSTGGYLGICKDFFVW